MAVQLFVTEVTQQTSGGDVFITIQHGTDNAVSKSKIKADIFPSEFFGFIGSMNDNFKTICELGGDTNYAITGFKIRDAKSGNQEIQFVVNIRTDYIFFENAKTDWLEIREIDTSQLQGGNSSYREKARAINALIDNFNNLQLLIRDNIAAWLEMESEEPQLSLFDTSKTEKRTRELLAAHDEYMKAKDLPNPIEQFHKEMQEMSDKNGTTMTISSNKSTKSVTFKPKNDAETLAAQLNEI